MYYQAEEAKTRGTPVTRESFLAWKAKFDKEMAAKRVKEQEEKSKNFTPKEREEHRKFRGRLSGTITSPGLPKSQLKRCQENNYLNVAETGAMMNRLKKTEFLSTSPNTSALARGRRRMKGIVSILATVISGEGRAESGLVVCILVRMFSSISAATSGQESRDQSKRTG